MLNIAVGFFLFFFIFNFKQLTLKPIHCEYLKTNQHSFLFLFVKTNACKYLNFKLKILTHLDLYGMTNMTTEMKSEIGFVINSKN